MPEIQVRPPLNAKTSMTTTLGGNAGDPGAPTTQHENVNGGPPWEVMLRVRERPPSYVGVIDGSPQAPVGVSDLQPSFEKCVVNLHGHHR
jgi:hypothetical protein